MVENYSSDSAVGGREVATNRISSLEGIRALAISLVVLSHLSGAPGFVTLPGALSDWFGDTGVRVFFVLSGFLITTLLLAEQSKFGGINLSRFYFRRCFRIFPAFYLFFAILVGVSALEWTLLQPGNLSKASLYIIDYCPWASTSNFVRHIWCLSGEEQFYLVWPIAIWALGVRRARWLAVFSIVASPFWRIVVISFLPAAAQTSDCRFDCLSGALATGCLLAWIGPAFNQSARYHAILRSRWMHVMPLLVLAASTSDGQPHIYFSVSDTVMNLGSAQARWHWFPALALTLAASAASYFLVEVPLQHWGRRLTQPQLSRSLAAT